MQVLTEQQREIVWLKFVEGYSSEEAAAAIGCDVDALRYEQPRALALMERAIETARGAASARPGVVHQEGSHEQ